MVPKRRLTALGSALFIIVLAVAHGLRTERSSRTTRPIAIPARHDATQLPDRGRETRRDEQPEALPIGSAAPASTETEPPIAWPAGVISVCLSGRVVDARGAPWPDARVLYVPDVRTTKALEGLPGGKPAEGADPTDGLPQMRTRADGRFDLCGPWQALGPTYPDRGDHDPALVITAPGMAWHGQPLHGFEGRSMDVGDIVLLHAGAGFRLRVVDAAGQPVPGVLAATGASAYQTPADDDPVPPSRISFGVLGTTGADGRLLSEHHWPSRLYLGLTKDGYERHSLRIDLTPGTQLDLGDVVLQRGLEVRGAVHDVHGRPVVGAEVLGLDDGRAQTILAECPQAIDLTAVLLDKAARTPMRSVTQAEGHFVLGSIPTECTGVTLLVTAPGCSPARLDAVVPGSSGLQVVLQPAAGLQVEVRGADTGERLAGAELRALLHTGAPEDPRGGQLAPSMTPLATEGLRVDNPGSLGSILFAAAPGYIPRRVEVGPCPAGEQRDVLIELQPGATLHGRVVDDLGQPVGDARVRLGPSSKAFESLWEAEVQHTTPDGRFAFPLLPAGRWSGTVTRPGHSHCLLEEFDSGAASDALEIVLPRGACIRGTVLDARGAPAVATLLELTLSNAPDDSSGVSSGSQFARTRSSREGHFEFTDLQSGLWTLRAEPGLELQVGVAPAQQVELSLRLAATPMLVGRTHAGGIDLTQVKVQAVRTREDGKPGQRVSTRSGIGGRYALALPGTGDYTLDFAAREGPWIERSIRVQPGDAPLLDVDFGTALLAGRLLGADRRPLAERTLISLVRDDVHAGSFQVDAEGRFSCAPLIAGRYRLHAQPELCLPLDETVELEPGEQRDDLEFVLQPAGRVTGTVRVDSGEPFVGFVHLRRTDGTPGYHVSDVEEGWFECAPLEPGGWRLDLATFPEELLGRGEGRRGEPGVELPLLGTQSFQIEASQTLELEVAARMPTDDA